MKWLRRAALGAALIFVLLVFGWLPYWLGGMFTHRRFTYRDTENAGLTPASFQLAFEDVSFTATDGVPLKGWWVPASTAKGTVVLVHGLNRSRIEMVKKAPFLHGLGWNALLFDLRHHGASGGDISTFGYLEKRDVHAAVAQARSRAAGPVVVWGISFGAAAATFAAAEDSSIAGLVADSAFRSLRDTVHHHFALLRGFRWWGRLVPTWPVSTEVLYWIGRRGGFDPDDVDVQQAAAKLPPRPALFVCNTGDRRMPWEIAVDLKKAAGERAELLVVPGKSHGGAYREGTDAYQDAVRDLLAAAADPAPRMASVRKQ